MSNTQITNYGLNYVTSAFNCGALIAIKYFNLVYDYRLDPTIRNNNIALSATSAVSNETIGLSAAPIGEIIWNNGTNYYELSDSINQPFILSGTSNAETTVGNSLVNSNVQVGPVPVNLVASTNQPLSNSYTGVSVTTSALGNWNFSPTLSAVVGYNPDHSTDKTRFFTVQDYFPIVNSGSPYLRGNFTCRVNQNLGNVKFNKIALYVVQYVGGIETGSAPGFFAEAYLDIPIVKTVLTNGYSEISIDVQLQLSATGNLDPSNIFYGTSADYLVKVQNGFLSSEKFAIGNFDNANAEPQATLHLGQVKDSSGHYEDIPHVRIEGVTSASPTDIFKNNIDITYYPSILGGSSTLALSSDAPSITITPEIQTYIGNITYPLHNITFSGGDPTLHTNYNLLTTNESYLQLNRELLQFQDDNTTSTATYNNTIYGSDLVRDTNDLLVQTRLGNVYILAGSQNQAGASNAANNSWQRHLYAISDVQNETPLSSTSNWLTSASTYILARSGIKAYGPLELNYIPKDPTYTTDAPITHYGVLATKKKYMSIMAGLQLGASFSATGYYPQYDYLLDANVSNTNNWNPLPTYIDSNSILFIQAGTTKFWCNVEPGIDNTFTLGAPYKNWNQLYTTTLFTFWSTPAINALTAVGTSITETSILYGMNVIGKITKLAGPPFFSYSTILVPATSYAYNAIYIGTGSNPVAEVNTEKLNVYNGSTDILYNIGNVTFIDQLQVNGTSQFNSNISAPNLDALLPATTPLIQATYSLNLTDSFSGTGNTSGSWIIPLSAIDSSLTIDNTLIIGAKITLNAGGAWYPLPLAVGNTTNSIYISLTSNFISINFGTFYSTWSARIQLLVHKMDNA